MLGKITSSWFGSLIKGGLLPRKQSLKNLQEFFYMYKLERKWMMVWIYFDGGASSKKCFPGCWQYVWFRASIGILVGCWWYFLFKSKHCVCSKGCWQYVWFRASIPCPLSLALGRLECAGVWQNFLTPPLVTSHWLKIKFGESPMVIYF